jgi:hypothetical protein
MTAMPLAPSAEPQSANLLAGALKARGLRHLQLAEPAVTYAAVDDVALIANLAGHADPRLREALIPLFLRHPELAEQARSLAALLEPDAADTLRHFYSAAVYLQRLWLSTLRLYLGSFPVLPDHFGQAYYHLPSPEENFGEAGLRSLARHYADETGLDWLSVYQSAMNLFLQQLSLDQTRHV